MSEPNYYNAKSLGEYLLAIEVKKTEIIINKPICVGRSILELSKILMYEFYVYAKQKYGEHVKLFYMDTDSLIFT